MVNLGPQIYEPNKSVEVLQLTEAFLQSNDSVRERLAEAGWSYHSIGRIIPQTTENFWSGHYFPYVESTQELQISINLALFGLYKQAFGSLRSALETGMLSVYYNINDEGHKVVQDWLKSKDTWEANTPRSDKIWKILRTNPNIKAFDDKYNLRAEFDSLSFLHNYVHTKGYKYSNSFGKVKSNWQTFEEDIFVNWCRTYEVVSIFLVKLHMLKYPISVIEFEWSDKIGIDNPYPVLETSEISRIQGFLPSEQFSEMENIAENDDDTLQLFEHIRSLPDMTEEEKETQIIDFDKSMIEHGQGFIEWEKQELALLKRYDSDTQKKVLERIEIVRKWAEDNDMMKPKIERLREE